jgi:hypothetical protein
MFIPQNSLYSSLTTQAKDYPSLCNYPLWRLLNWIDSSIESFDLAINLSQGSGVVIHDSYRWSSVLLWCSLRCLWSYPLHRFKKRIGPMCHSLDSWRFSLRLLLWRFTAQSWEEFGLWMEKFPIHSKRLRCNAIESLIPIKKPKYVSKVQLTFRGVPVTWPSYWPRWCYMEPAKRYWKTDSRNIWPIMEIPRIWFFLRLKYCSVLTSSRRLHSRIMI